MGSDTRESLAGGARALGGGLGGVVSDGVVGVEHTVNDVNDTTGEEDVGVDDLCAVDVVAAVEVLYCQVCAAEGGDGGVGDHAAVENAVVHDVVAEDRDQL